MAGVGNGFTVRLLRHSIRKREKQARPDLRNTAPILDPTGSLLIFVYHCFDRIVINGYLSGLSRPEQVVWFFREVLGFPVVSKEVLSQRTKDYQGWVEA